MHALTSDELTLSLAKLVLKGCMLSVKETTAETAENIQFGMEPRRINFYGNVVAKNNDFALPWILPRLTNRGAPCS